MVELLVTHVVAHRLWIAAAVVAFVWLAEALHHRRIRKVARLLQGPSAKPLRWLAPLAWINALACGTVCWGLATLVNEGGTVWSGASAQIDEHDLHHLVIGLDVSPSMKIVDSGDKRQSSRGERASEVLRLVLSQWNPQRTRVSILAFYSEAMPVVIDTFDPAVVHNILDDLPLEHAFKAGKTDLYSLISKTNEVSKKWTKASTTLIVCTDGDTLPARQVPTRPAAIDQVIVLGVGDAHRGTFIQDHISKQDRQSLNQFAAQFHGQYIDVNSGIIDQQILPTITNLQNRSTAIGLREIALWLIAIAGAWLAVLPVVLTWVVGAWNPSRTPGRRLSKHDFAEAVS